MNRYSLKLEREILQRCYDWRFSPEFPEGGLPISYPETRDDYAAFLSEITSDDIAQWKHFESQLDMLRQRGWLKLELRIPTTPKDSLEGHAFITGRGVDRLEWHRSQDLMPRLTRFLGSATGVLITSVVTPVVVAILTVIAMRHFGLY